MRTSNNIHTGVISNQVATSYSTTKTFLHSITEEEVNEENNVKAVQYQMWSVGAGSENKTPRKMERYSM